MPRPESIVTEDQFPLDHAEEEALVEPFGVLVQWPDLSESPSQAIARLNGEVLEQAERGRHQAAHHAKVVGQYVKLSEYRVAVDGMETMKVTHLPCESVVAQVSRPDYQTLGRVVEYATGHDCSIDGRVRYAADSAKTLANTAVATLRNHRGMRGEEPDQPAVEPEYLRGLAHMVLAALSLPAARLTDVGEYLWERAGGDPAHSPTRAW